MRVSELIAELQTFNPDSPVSVVVESNKPCMDCKDVKFDVECVEREQSGTIAIILF